MAGRENLRPWYVLSILSALYVVSFIDRIALNLLVEPLKASFSLGDVQISLMQGAGFAAAYGIVGVPLARVADLHNRKMLILVGVLVWSLSTLGSAFATSFSVLFVLRMGLAVGEAALSPAALSIISDTFDQRRRSLAGSLYITAGLAGSFIAFLAGASVVAWVGEGRALEIAGFGRLDTWRAVFLVVSLPGLALAILLGLTVPEPARHSQAEVRPTFLQLLGAIKASPRVYGNLLAGGALVAVGFSTLATWIPSVLIREHGYSIPQAGVAFGVVGLISSALGTVFIPRAGERLPGRGPQAGLLQAGVMSVAFGTLGLVILFAATNGTTAILGIAIAVFGWYGGMAVPILVLQQIAPARMRATLTSLLLLGQTVIGFSAGPTLVAWLAGSLHRNDAALSLSLSVVASIIAPAAMLLLWSARRAVTRSF